MVNNYKIGFWYVLILGTALAFISYCHNEKQEREDTAIFSAWASECEAEHPNSTSAFKSCMDRLAQERYEWQMEAIEAQQDGFDGGPDL